MANNDNSDKIGENRGKYTKLVAIIIIIKIIDTVVYLGGEGEGLGFRGPRFYDCLLTMQHVPILYSKKNGDADILALHDTPKPLKGRQVELQNVLTTIIFTRLI